MLINRLFVKIRKELKKELKTVVPLYAFS